MISVGWGLVPCVYCSTSLTTMWPPTPPTCRLSRPPHKKSDETVIATRNQHMLFHVPGVSLRAKGYAGAWYLPVGSKADPVRGPLFLMNNHSEL